jgi:hypothetical protein
MSNHAMVVRSDARAMGAITALSAPMRRKPNMSDYRTGNRAGECISYFKADRSDAVIFRAERINKPNRRFTPERAHRITCADLAPIGNVL